MAPLSRFPASRAARVKALFTDIDDTMTTGGRLTADAFDALWKLHDAGVAVVPVTGRPAGWCDHFARMWPVAAVVGENGALFFRYDAERREMQRGFASSEAERASAKKRLDRLAKAILRKVPGSALSIDQPYRIHDLAIDFCEDVEPLDRAAVDEIVAMFERAGATAKVSSIHVNGWFGQWDKIGMIKRVAQGVLGLDLDRTVHNRRCVYVGDSPNDEPAFAAFDYGIGVANIRDFADRLEHPPAFVTPAVGGAGFAQVARKILRAKRAASR